MKKILFMLMLLTTWMNLSKLFSQDPPPPCWMDCPNSIWVLKTINMRLGDICPLLPMECINANLEITFWHRHAECPDPNPPWGMINQFDCQIKSISYPEVCNVMCISQLDIIDIYKIALKRVYNWMFNEYGFNPNNPTIWRAVNVSCWGRFVGYGDSIVVEYCPNYSENCCWKTYNVEIENGNPVFTLIAAYIPEGAPPDCSLHTRPCYYFCDMDNLEEAPPNKQAVNDDGVDFVSIEYENLFDRMNQNYNGHTINIFDINGKFLYSIPITTDYTSSIVMNLSTGIYFYKVIDKSNAILENGKFIKY